MSYPVWDVSQRLVHWLLPILIGFSWWSAENDRMQWHAYAGYALLSLVIWRLLWGFVGSHYARFGQFWPSLSRLRSYMKRGDDSDLGHNPLGALSVFTLLLLILTQAVSGLFNTDELFLDGPLVVIASDTVIELSSEVHELGWLLLQVFIGLHLAAITWYRFVKKRNLVLAMWFGKGVPKLSEHRPRSVLLALSLLVGVVLTGWGLGSLLPEPEPLYYW